MNYISLSLTLFLSTFSYSDNNNPDNIYGYWLNNDSEILLIQTNNTFTRSDKYSVLAEGKLEFIDNKILVFRTDTEEEYIEMLEASRQYQNNIEVISTIKALMLKTANLGK